jgi:hypothetical protein
MHDRNGTPLKLGDIVTVKFRITATSSSADYCNVTLESVEGRKPDGAKETLVGNAAVTVLQESASE